MTKGRKVIFETSEFGPTVKYTAYKHFNYKNKDYMLGLIINWKLNKDSEINTFKGKHRIGLNIGRDKMGLFHD